jgi:hypothetical protein
VVTRDIARDWLRTPERTLKSHLGAIVMKPGQTGTMRVSNMGDINTDVSTEVRDNDPGDE